LVNFDNYAAGTRPLASLTLGPDGNFYSTTVTGSTTNTLDTTDLGTIFRVTTNGTLTTLVNFNNTNGANPEASLTLGPDNNLYGTATSGGAGGNGTVFKLALPPILLAVASSGGGNYTVFVESFPNSTNRLWATTDLALPSSWQVIGAITTDGNGLGQFLDTDTADMVKFYRLSYP
jgi:uncharacterized repeat protein (TIGR03803 family)